MLHPGYIAILLLLAIATAGSAAAPSSQPPAAGFVDVPGGKLSYEISGSGPPLVILHDGLLPSAAWDEPARSLARDFTVVRYDRRGYGRSSASTAPYSNVDDLAALRQALHLAPSVLVGCSDGAKLAVDYTLAHPADVTALVLAGPVVSGLAYSGHFDRRNLANYRPVFAEKSLAKAAERWADDPWLTLAQNTAARERLRRMLREHPEPIGPAAFQPTPPERPAISRLGEIRVPTLLVVGAGDIPDVHAHAGALAAGIADAERVVLPGAGHLVFLEIPQLFDDTVRRFLRPDRVAADYLASVRDRPIFAEGRHLFDYDARAPLDAREAGTETRGDARVVDLSYASPRGGRVPAYLVLPAAKGPSPAVLFLHPGQGDRKTFVAEAVELAGRGIVSLSIGAPFTRAENKGVKTPPWDPDADRAELIQTIVDLRRGLDLLASRPEVDASHLAYVGHSLGATLGGPLCAVESRRLRVCVLMAGFAAQSDAWLHGTTRGAAAFQTLLPAEQQGRYAKALLPLDSVYYLPHTPPVRLLFQFARHDEFIARDDAELSKAAAPPGREVQWYDTGHFFNDAAKVARDGWLVEVLGRR